MINNTYMYNLENYKNAAQTIMNLTKQGLISFEESCVLESSLRNQCIVITGTDLGETLSFDDFIISGHIINEINAMEKVFRNRRKNNAET